MFDVRRLPRRSFFAQMGFDVFLFLKGRVAESGLRHSTRNRAWGNPPWVRIPPLPPFLSFNLISDVLPFGGLWKSTIALASAQQRDFFFALRRAARDRRFVRHSQSCVQPPR